MSRRKRTKLIARFCFFQTITGESGVEEFPKVNEEQVLTAMKKLEVSESSFQLRKKSSSTNSVRSLLTGSQLLIPLPRGTRRTNLLFLVLLSSSLSLEPGNPRPLSLFDFPLLPSLLSRRFRHFPHPPLRNPPPFSPNSHRSLVRLFRSPHFTRSTKKVTHNRRNLFPLLVFIIVSNRTRSNIIQMLSSDSRRS